MKKIFAIFALLGLIGCDAVTQKAPQDTDSKKVGMANPASTYCIKMGGKLEIVKEEGGDVGYCLLPSGERIEEWAFFRKNHE